ncbi:ammonium transporter [Nocardioidaceae bacterium]|nr:ammonium transporter [Nocardioidaceae bacterium]
MDGYNAFMLVATLLVVMMTVPALALFYGGMTRSKSVLNMMMMSYSAMAIVGIIWVLWGYSMVFTGDSPFTGSPFNSFGLSGLDYGGYTFMMFQLTFAVITTALISGAIADRVKFSAWLLFVPLWATLSYFPMAHMVFGCDNGGLICADIGAQDYAGGTAVHINSGVAALVLVLVIGKRLGFGKSAMRPHNLTLTMLGAALLWIGWYGFNVGSLVFVDGIEPSTQFLNETGLTFANTTLAAMAAIIGWLVVEKALHGKVTTLGAASGIVAGLVGITPAAGAVNIVGALAIGAITGAACSWAVGLKYKLGYDDSLDVVGVHLVGGIVGTLLIGLFSVTAAEGSGIAGGAVDGLFYGGGFESLVAQALGVLVAIGWSGVMTLVIALAIKFTIGWRVEEEAEIEGIDYDQHGETAYDLVSRGGGSSSKSGLTGGTSA